MFQTIEKIPNGFGARLKEERKSLGFTQEEFASKFGIQRFTQYQYEAEINSPTVRYLEKSGEIGVDIAYLIFGIRMEQLLIAEPDMSAVERKAFDLLEHNESIIGERFTPEKRYIMFDLIRSQLLESRT